MVCDLEPTRYDGEPVWRVGHAPTPWRFTDWAYADTDGRFDGRWDDPHGSYRVLYTSTSRLGAFVEALGDFRTDPHVAAGLKDIVTDGEDEDEGPGVPPGHVPVSWVRGRVLGEATVTLLCAQVGHSRSLAELRRRLSALVVRYRLDDLDASAIRIRAPRAFTQRLSRFIYECTDTGGTPQFDGIHYQSRFGDDLHNLALFELPDAIDDAVTPTDIAPINPHDTDLEHALQHHGLHWFDDTDA